METLEIKVANIKCNGCAANIKNGLAGMDGIESVEVDVPGGLVTISGNALAREAISAKLAELGYPEKAA